MVRDFTVVLSLLLVTLTLGLHYLKMSRLGGLTVSAL